MKKVNLFLAFLLVCSTALAACGAPSARPEASSDVSAPSRSEAASSAPSVSRSEPGEAGTQPEASSQPAPAPEDASRSDDDEVIGWGDDDEIIDPNDFDEIPMYETYEDGDWVWAKLESGNWRAFSYKGSDEAVTIPSEFRGGTVTEVGVWCFRDNTALKRVTIPDCVVVIDENCFMGCVNLESVQMPPRLDFMGDQTFAHCTSLARCVVPEGVQDLDYRQFDECENMREVVLPASLTHIGEAAFRHCYSLETIYFRGSRAAWSGVTIASNALNDSSYRVVTDYAQD